MSASRILALPGFMLKLFADIPELKISFAALGAMIGYFFPTDVSVNAALAAFCLVILDTLTGLVASWTSSVQISSAKFARVLVKLVGYGSVIIVSSLVARNIPGAMEYQGAGVSAVLFLIIGTESISILENVEKMGIELPFGLHDFLKKRFGRAPNNHSGDQPGQE